MAGNLRSPRKRALEIGTNSSGFPSDVAYNPSQGAPDADVGGEYTGLEVDMPKSGGATPPSPFGNLR